MQAPNSFRGGPDERGHFGIYGGRYVAETLMPLVLAVEAAYGAARADPAFQAEPDYYLQHYVGRPRSLMTRRTSSTPARSTRPSSAGRAPGGERCWPCDSPKPNRSRAPLQQAAG